MTTLIDATLSDDLVHGAAELHRDERGLVPLRLPRWASSRGADAQMVMAAAQPSGVRVAFHSAATVVELETIPIKRVYDGAPARPDGKYDLVVDGRLVSSATVPDGDVLRLSLSGGDYGLEPGASGTARFDGLAPGLKRIEIWLPHDESTRLVALRTDAPVTPLDHERRVWLHHGSSISQGSNATQPTGTWPAVAARRAGWDLVNRGFGGSALVDPFVAQHLSATPADLISIKLGINLVNTDLMRRRAFVAALHGFVDRVREGHPDTPLWLITPVFCPIHEQTPGPAFPDPDAYSRGELRFRAVGSADEVPLGKLTLQVIREVIGELVSARAEQDPNLHLFDGLRLFGPSDHDRHPLPDGLHPVPQTHLEMGERFADAVLART